MRIIHAANVRWFNATAWYALRLSHLLEQDGHEVLVLALPGTETEEKARELGLTVKSMDLNTTSPHGLAALAVELGRLVSSFRPDIVDCHRGESFILWGMLRRLRGGFGLVRTRGDQRRPKNNVFNRWLHVSAADAVVATNTATAAYFREVIGVPEDKLSVILGGVDRERFRRDPEGRERVRREFGFAPGDTVIGLLGRFDRVKGQRELVEAVARLRQDRAMSGLRLFLIGFETATSLNEVRQWIDEAGLGEVTAISGKRPDIPACISALDVGVVASLWSETIARAALEIMSCGVPLLGSRVGVMPDLLTDEALFPPGDVSAMAGTIGRAVSSPAVAARLAAEQARRIDELSDGEFLRQSLRLYQSVLSRRSA